MTAEAILAAVAGNLVVAAALAAAAGLLGRSARWPAAAHALWVLVLLKLLTPPLVRPAVPVLPAAEPAPVASAPAVADPVPATALPTAGPVPTVHVDLAVDPVPHPAGSTWNWPPLVFAVWAVGAAAYLAVVAARATRFTRLLRYAAPAPDSLAEEVAAVAREVGLRRPPPARVLPGAIAPFVWAVGRPALFLPADLLTAPPDRRAAVLAHELSHLRRGDPWVRWLEVAATAAYWWCPLVWVARRELRRLEEEACDAEAAAARPGSAHDYAAALLDTLDLLAGDRAPAPAPALATGMGTARSLRRRLVLILDGRRATRNPAAVRLGLLAVGGAALALSPAPARVSAALADLFPEVVAASAPARDADPARYAPTPRPLAGLPRATAAAAAASADGLWYALADGPDVAVFDRHGAGADFRLSHPAAVQAVAFGPTGRTLTTACADGSVRLWANGRCVHTLAGHAGWVRAAAYAPDGRTLATGGYDRTVRLWDAETGRPIRVWSFHAAGVRSVAFTPDGTAVVTAAADGSVRVTAVADGSSRPLDGHTAGVRAVAVSRDGRRVAAVADDDMLRVWNLADGRSAVVRLPDTGTAVRFTPGGRAIVAGTAAGQLVVVDVAAAAVRGFVGVSAGDPEPRSPHAGPVLGLAATPAGLLTLGADGAALLWPVAGTADAAADFHGHPGAVVAVAVSPDGRTVATAGADGSVRLWDAATGRPTVELAGHVGGATGVLFAAGGRQVVSVGADETVRVWEAATGRPVRAVAFPSADLRLAVSPNGSRLVVGGPALPGVSVVEAESGRVLHTLTGDAGRATAVALHPDGTRLATGHRDGRLSLWDPATGEELSRAVPHRSRGPITGLAFHPDGTSAAVLADDPDRPAGFEVLVWTPADGAVEPGRRPLTHPGPVAAAAYSPDGQRLVTAARDGNLYVWDAAAGRPVATIPAHAGPAAGLAVPGDGSAVVSAGDAVARRWPLAPGGSP